MVSEKFEAALAEALQAERRAPGNLDALLMQARALIGLTRYREAEAVLRRVCLDDPGHAVAYRLRATANWRDGAEDAGIDDMARALALAPAEDAAMEHGWMLLRKGRLDEAERAFSDVLREVGDRLPAYKYLSDIASQRGDWDNAAAIARKGCLAFPGDFWLRDRLIGSLIAADRHTEALEEATSALEAPRSDEERVSLLMQLAGIQEVLFKDRDAVDALLSVLRMRPDRVDALEKLCNLRRSRHRDDEVEPLQRRLRSLHSLRLPDHLAEELARIWGGASDDPADEEALRWASEFADRAGLSEEAWRQRAIRGRQANILLARWYECASTPQLQQIYDLIDLPDMSGLREVMLERGTTFLACGHVGPSAAGMVFLSASNNPFRVVSSADRGRADSDVLIPVSAHGVGTMRNVVSQMGSDAQIAFMADESQGFDHLSVEFLGRRVELPPQFPKFIQKYGAPSFWICPLWRDGRIAIELARLPDPEADEPRQDWVRRWFRAYLARLERVMRGTPENLGLRGGIWSNVNRKELLRRRHRPGRTTSIEGRL